MNGERHSGSLECVDFLENRNTQPPVAWDVLFLKFRPQNCPGEMLNPKKKSHTQRAFLICIRFGSCEEGRLTRAYVCLSIPLQQVIDFFVAGKSWYFA